MQLALQVKVVSLTVLRFRVHPGWGSPCPVRTTRSLAVMEDHNYDHNHDSVGTRHR